MLLGALQVGVEEVKLHSPAVSLRRQHVPAHAEKKNSFKISELLIASIPGCVKILNSVVVKIDSPFPQQCCHKVVVLLGGQANIVGHLGLNVIKCFWYHLDSKKSHHNHFPV